MYRQKLAKRIMKFALIVLTLIPGTIAISEHTNEYKIVKDNLYDSTSKLKNNKNYEVENEESDEQSVKEDLAIADTETKEEVKVAEKKVETPATPVAPAPTQEPAQTPAPAQEQESTPVAPAQSTAGDTVYAISQSHLTYRGGVFYFEGHKETYYTEEVLPGGGLRIPGRHVAYDGTIRDENSYIVVAANTSYLPKGSIVNTSLGTAKVYDSGCAYGTIDIYVNGAKFRAYENSGSLNF